LGGILLKKKKTVYFYEKIRWKKNKKLHFNQIN